MAFRTILVPGLVLGLAVTALAWFLIHKVPESAHPKVDAPITNMVSGLILIFAFVVGFTVSQESSALGTAANAASAEANSIGELYWYAHALSEPAHSRLQGELRTYTRVVADKEWPLLQKHRSSPEAADAIDDIRFDVLSFEPITPTEKAIYGNMLSQVGDLFKARHNRLDIATNGSAPPILRQGLLVLALTIIVVIPFAGKVDTYGELAIYGMFTCFLIATLFFISDLNQPFKGNVAVKPTSFNLLYTGTFKNVP